MGWTKDEVDKYVAKVERNMNSPREKNLKGFAFARLYREARDNVKAKRHLEAYLSVNESDFRGHRMMGQLFEETGNLEKALLSYRRSLDLNNTQHDLVLKVVELYCQVPVDPGRARAWADRAARLYPGHAAVFKLRMHLLESVGKIDYEQIEDLISEEMTKRPRDAKLHIRLIKVYAATGRLVEAYSHCASVVRTKAFDGDSEWWMCAVDVFEKYMAGQDKMIPSDRDIGAGHVILDSHAHLMAALSQLLNLYLKTEKTRETINLFYRLDHCLTMANERKVRNTARGSQSQKSEWDVVLAEMRGQLYLHCAALILKLAKENYLTWPRALKLASVCNTTCAQVHEPDITTPWVAKAPKNKDALRWYHMACYRLSHAGHLLEAVIHKYGEEWLDNCISDWCTQQGQDEILNTVYDEHRDKSKSFLANDEEFFVLEINLPSVEQLVKYDEVCVGNNPRNLELITWIGLHWYHYERSIRPGVGVIVARIFDGLRMDVPNIEQTAADTLCLRDLEAFVYAVIRTSAAKFLEDQDLYVPDYQPQILPQQLCDRLTSPAQEEWWLAAYNLYAGAASVSSAGRVRATVQRGLEVIRALGVHGLHVRLLIYLAFNFGDKASYLKTAGGVNPWYYEEHWKSLQARSLHYWKEALILLEKIEKNENIPIRKDPLFPLLQNSLMKIDIKFNIQKARLILGEAALREGKIEEAMEMFEQVKTTQGMWNLAQIYKYLANVEAQAAASEDLDSDAQSGTPAQEYYNCLNKARELLLACIDKVPGEERRRQTLQDELNDIEDMLNEDPNRVQANPRKQLDFRQLDFQVSRSSTTMSDVQESEDNFWLEQPQDASSKDLIAKLSEVTLNNGYLQEQMAVRDQHLKELNSKVQSLETELRELKQHGFSGFMSPINYPSPAPVPSIPTQHNLPTFVSPVTQGAASIDALSTTPTNSRHQTPQNGRPLESTPVVKPSVKSRLGPRIPVETTPEPPKIDSKFFAGLSQTNSPEKKSELEQSEEGESEQGSVRHDSTSLDDGIHFEPIIPLPKQIVKKTGEEGEVVLFNKRAKLYRYDKDLKSWKERGTGNLKILSAVGQTRFRILMRREHILKICANHLITTEMELKPLQAGSQNSLVWSTAADFADETTNVEQLAVRFKLTEETAEFKAVFENCKSKLSGASFPTSPIRLNMIGKDKAGVSKEPGSWECSICSRSNLPNTFICNGCGANNADNSSAVSSTTEKDGALAEGVTKASIFTKFLPKAGSWECSSCLVNNEEKESECVACGASKPGSKDSVLTETTNSKFFTQSVFPLPKSGFGSAEKVQDSYVSSKEQASSDGDQKASLFGTANFSFAPQNSAFNKPPTDVSFALPQGNEKQASIQEPDATQKFPFEYNPEPLKPEESEEASFKRGGFGQQPTPFSFNFKPSSTSSSSPLSFSFGKTQAPSFTLAPFGVSTTPNTSSQVTSSSSQASLSFGSPSNGTPKSEGTQNKEDSKEVKPLTFSTSPSNALPGFDIDDDDEEEKVSASGDAVVPSGSSGMFSAPQQATPPSSSVPPTIPPQLFWEQQLEEKFKFGNLHKTEPLAGMAPVVVSPPSGKPDAMYPASFILSKLASKSASPPVGPQLGDIMGDSEGNVLSLQQLKDKSTSHGTASQGSRRPDLLVSLLQSKPRETLTSGSNQLQGSSNLSTVTPDDSSKTSEDLDEYSDDLDTESDEESGSYHSSDDYDEDEDYSHSYEDDLNKTVVSQPSPTTHQLLPQGQIQMPMPPLMSIAPGISGRKFLTPRSPLKKGQPKEDECFVIYEIRAAMTDRDKASRLLLPLNFFNHARTEPCPGCLGCDDSVRLKMKQDSMKKSEKDNMATSTQLKPEDSSRPSPKEENHIFGASLGAKALSFASFPTTTGSTFEKKDTTHRVFPMAGQQLFGSPNDASDETDIYFKPLIPLPELIKTTTGEEDHTLLFSERARLYRFDASSSMWKERGIGDIKLLLDNKTGRGRVVMRREQVHKLCANHWIMEDMELRTNSTSDRSWVWQTLADFSEETPSQEKLAVRLKSPEIALKFKDQFDDLVALARKMPKENKVAGKMSEKASEEQSIEIPTSASTAPVLVTSNKGQSSAGVETDSLINKFKPKPGAWECEVCMVPNNPGTTACAACNTPKPGQKSEPAANIQTSQKVTFGSSQGTGFSIPKSTTPKLEQQQHMGETDGMAQSKATLKPVFTIGRGDAPEEEELEEETYRHSPIKTSPNKIPSKTSPTSVLPPPTGTPTKPATGFAFGSLSHTKFSFKLELSPEKETPKSSLKSPQSPTSPESPGKHPEAEDDNIHFEPIIPLPKKISKKTGEENDEVLFCQRAKLYRFDNEVNQWKERGVGDIKILKSSSSGISRVVMRRDVVLKLCTNHQITPEMTLKPNSGSEKSWVWNTLADFADEVAKQETLAVRFKTAEIAQSFKDAFEKAKEKTVQTQVSEGKDEGTQAPKEDDSTRTQESEETLTKQSTEDQELPEKTPVAEKDQKSKDDVYKTESKKEEPQSSGFLFGSSNISSLSFASIASNIGSSPGILGSTKSKEGLKAGPTLFSRSPAHRRESEGSEGEERHEDGPHFEPLVPLPEKVEARTGEEEEELIFSHRAKLYRFDRDLKQWKERGVGDIKILLHKKNSRVRILMRRDHILKICANHYVTPEMTLNPNGTSTKSWVWNTLADFSDEEVKAEQLAVRFKFEETAREFKEKFDKCQEKMVHHNSEVVYQSKTTADKITDDSQESIVDTEEKDESLSEESNVKEKSSAEVDETDSYTGFSKNDGEKAVSENTTTLMFGSEPQAAESKDTLMDKFKAKPGSWECEVCLVPNNADSIKCAACYSPKPGVGTSQVASSTQSTPAFGFGGPEATGFSFGNGSSAPVSFGDVSFGLPSKDTPSKMPQFAFGNASVPKEDTATSKAGTTNDFGVVTDSTPTQETKKDSLMDKFKAKPGSWECEVCLVPNNADSIKCAACYSPKPGVVTSQAASSTQSTPAFGFGGPEATGFSFGNGSSAPASFGGVSFGLPSKDTPSKMPQFAFGNASVPKEDTATSKAGTTNDFGVVTDSTPTQETKKDSLMDKFKAKPGSWECEVCLVPNNADSIKCAACYSPKPGVVTSQAASSTQSTPAFGFGGPEATGFSFGNGSSAPASFGGVSFGLPSKDTSSKMPQFAFGNASVPKEDTATSKAGTTNDFGVVTDSTPTQETKKDSLMDKFKAKPGSWECEVCLVPNNADSIKCAACYSPKPGVVTSQAASSTQSTPAFGFGGPEATGFSFGNGSSAPASFGGVSFGLPSKDTSSKMPQFAFGNASVPKEDTATSKAGTTNDFGVVTDSTPTQETKKDSLMDKFKAKPGSWECEVCLVPNNADSIKCAACYSPKPGVVTSQAASSTQSTPAFGFGGPEATGFSFGNGSSAPASFGGVSFGLPSKDTPSKMPQFAFGNASVPKEGTATSKPDTTNDFGVVTDSTPTQETKKDSLMDKFKAKPGSWECEVCLVPNNADSIKCAACYSPKPGVVTSQAASSTQSTPAFGFGGPEATGFSFENGSSAPASFGGVSFGLPSKDTPSKMPQFAFGNASVPKEDTATSKPDTTNDFGVVTDSTPTQETKKDSLMDKFKAKPGSWECEVCLVSNNADSTSCAACSSPKPGVDTSHASLMDKFKAKPGSWECEMCLVPNNADSIKCAACSSPNPGVDTSQAASSTQNTPAFGFGGPEATGFSFGNGSSAPASFGGVSFGLPKDTSSQKPQFAFGNTSVPKEGAAASKSGTANVFGFAADSSKTGSKIPEFTFGAPKAEQSTKDKESKSSAPMTEAVIKPKEEIKTEKAEADSTDATKTRKQDIIDLTLTSVVQPSEEEKRRAQSLLLPEGFFLYERQTQAPGSVVKAKTVSPKCAPLESKITAQEEAKKNEEPQNVFGSSSVLSFSSFSDVSTNGDFQFGTEKTSKGFTGQGTQLFSSPRGTDGGGTENEQDIYFKPLVSLSEIEVVTGEENEEKLFGHRAKLYRFDDTLSQWKERGVGEIKILKNKNSKKSRVVMRRDQIHKVCANHIITTDMNLVLNAGNDRSWVWHTLADLSEEEPKAEKLAVRFKAVETAKDFKKVFEECQKMLREQEEEVDTESEIDNEAGKEPTKTSSSSESQEDSVSEVDSTSNATDIKAPGEMHQMSKPSNEQQDRANEVESSDDAKWKCGVCNVSNDSSSKTCRECRTPRQGSDGGISRSEILDTKEKQDTPEPDSTVSVSEYKDSPKPETSKPEFLFGTQSISSLSFSDVGKVGIFGKATSSSEAFSFKGLNDQKPVEDKEADDDHDDGYHDVSGDHIHFEPIIALPDKIKAVTGEENEGVVFKQRAKLFRYDKELKQWKERGVGEIKILTGKAHSRIVMRRDHIHKLCANHLITINMTLSANNSDRSWVWQTLADISEEEPKEELLAVRFKTAETAQEFKKKFEECRDYSDPSDVTTVEASDEKGEPSVKEDDEKGVSDRRESALENPQEIPSSSTSPSKEAIMPIDSTQMVAGSPSTTTQDAFRSTRTVKKEVKHFTSTTTSGQRTEQSAIAKSYQEQNVVQSDGTRTEESQQMASLALQEKKITSSGEEKPFPSSSFSPGARGMMQPSIFNQELMFRQAQPSIFNQELSRQGAGLFGRTPVFPTGSPEFQMFGAQSSIEQPSFSQVPDSTSIENETRPQGFCQTERRTVEMTQQVSSSVITSSESKIDSCSPEITRMLKEIQDEDQNTKE